jgi:hypothetical protein
MSLAIEEEKVLKLRLFELLEQKDNLTISVQAASLLIQLGQIAAANVQEELLRTAHHQTRLMEATLDKEQRKRLKEDGR